MVEFDWAALKDVGVGGLGMFALYLMYKSFIFFTERWKESTDAINRNTETHQNLTNVFQSFHAESQEFQKEAMDLLKDTNDKVKDIHKDFRGR